MKTGDATGIEKSTPDIRNILKHKSLTAHFQQIVSVSRKTVTGLEGLIRGVDPETKSLIPPIRLFNAARDENLVLELDRASRDTIIGAFSGIHQCDGEKLLFLNLDASVLENAVGSNYLYQQVKRCGIDPGNVVIEISEKRVLGNAALKKFADTYRDYGFLVALDDVGSEFSNMDRILLVRPDIIKIDQSLVRNISSDFYKQGVFKSLVILSNKIGALVIAEGVETEEEAIQVLRLGGHMIQGFFLSVPGDITGDPGVFSNEKISRLSRRFNEYMNLQYQQERSKNKRLNRIAVAALGQLAGRTNEEFDDALQQIIAGNKSMECAYILDHTGVQVSGTICASGERLNAENLIFYSAKKGTDHSMEKYFYPLMSAKLKKYTTEPYISLATGNLCITVSAVFTNKDGNRYILCTDFRTTEESYNIELRIPAVQVDAGEKSDIASILSKISEDALRDSLTGAFNRRYLTERLVVDIFNAEMHNQPLSVILADIDRFKEVNDKYGHLAGDRVLEEFVAIARKFIRKNTDWIARYGGDEFVIVLCGADGDAAGLAAEKLRLKCEQTVIRYGLSEIKFTASFGTYTMRRTESTVDDLIGMADKNLYTAKKAGRNQVVSASDAPALLLRKMSQNG